jgi:pyruvate,water dikinase
MTLNPHLKVMNRLSNLFKKLFYRKPRPAAADVEELRIAFKERYHNFKLLLNANNRSLEVMANIEAALQGQRPFGMSFVKASYTAVSVNVLHMIKNIDALSHGKYQELYARFNAIQQHIDRLLTQKTPVTDQRLLIPFSLINKDMADLVGSKMANLGEIKNNIHLRVPEGFVITSFAYARFIKENDLQAEIDRLIQSADMDHMEQLYTLSAEIQQLIIRARMPQDLADAVMETFRQLKDATGKEITLALRSSALGEDAAGSSFAGQYRSELNVSAENIFQAYKEVVASKYSLQAISYRLNRGFKDEDISMCVGCMVMVDAVAGGVTYSRNPVDFGDDSIFINAAWGLPKSVVDGSVSCDLLVVSRKMPMTVIHEDIKNKERKFVCLPEEGVRRIDLSAETASLPTIDRDQACVLAELAVKLEEYYGSPQDIEWAIDPNGSIYILQCRPLQPMEPTQPGFGETIIKSEEENVIVRGGITASPGSASGPVYLADKGIDILQFPKGAVLVTRQALPRWASLLNRAAAVVTQQGGFAGHLANVAREFRVPALFGVKEVMDILKNGEEITVDAGNLLIFKGRIATRPEDSRPKKNLMEGSPVYETLKQISRSIVPLNLLEPDAPEFRPVNCTTFHDITRFIHEKSVQEMFNFGKEHHFSERSSKQLFYHVPMQWWILNLDDGFKEEIEGKHVKLENIVSIPMLAFWDGFAAIPWDGPPAIDGKGLISVMFRSTTNTALTPGVRSTYADRNYFMISKYFCSLSSRLGYHFSIMEALVSERSIENYVSFQFKGGAADFQRRVKRVHFIKDILEEYEFRIEVKEDMLMARLEGHELDFMKNRLAILGYLTLHTRQLDMIMENEASLAYYRSKLKKDIQTLLNGR